MKKRIFLYLIFICFFILPTFMTVSMMPAAARDVRVGYIDHPGFLSRTDTGFVTGYGADYFQKIAAYTGWNVQYVFDSRANLEESLQTGNVDFIFPLMYTPDRLDRYHYANFSIGTELNYLYARIDDDSIYYEDFSAFQNRRIAVTKNSFQEKALKDYAKKEHFQYVETVFDSYDNVFHALDTGQVDLAAASSLTIPPKNYKIVGCVAVVPFYIVAGRQYDAVLVNQLNDALGKIKYITPEFEPTLQDTYYAKNMLSTVPLFTRQDMEYIRSHGNITIGNFSQRYPLSYWNASTGKIEGIAIDILKLIEARSGLCFQYTAIPSGEQPIDYLLAGNVDLISGIVYNQERIHDGRLHLSIPYLNGKMVLVGDKNQSYDPDKIYTVALPFDAKGIIGYVHKYHPNYTIRFYPASTECLEAVNNGTCDIMIQNTYIVTALLQQPRFENLAVWLTTGIAEEKFSIVSSSHYDPRLIEIINKSLDSISKEEIKTIIFNHTTNTPYVLSAADIAHKYNIEIGMILLILLLCLGLYIAILQEKKDNISTLELKNTQLTDAITQAEYASNAKGQFLARMSHEIRTPMNAIIGMANLALKHDSQRERLMDHLAKINQSSHLLLNIINDILDMSAIERDQLHIENKPFILQEVLQELCDVYAVQCQQKHIQFHIDIEQKCYRQLCGDRNRLAQILLNLLSNAVKFTPSGGCVQLQVEQVNELSGKLYIQFIIADTGIGMNEEFKARIFKPFEQASTVTFQKYGGSGLGLSITKSLVELMNGKITVRSALDKGTTFTVILPFEIFDSPVFEPNKPPAGIDGTTTAINRLATLACKQKRILLVEDNDINREVAADLIKMTGATVDFALDGQDAVQRFCSSPPGLYDLIFMDIQMPRMDGYEATRLIRGSSHAQAQTIPIIAMTANAFTEDISKALLSGMNEHMAKPIELERLCDILDRYLG